MTCLQVRTTVRASLAGKMSVTPGWWHQANAFGSRAMSANAYREINLKSWSHSILKQSLEKYKNPDSEKSQTKCKTGTECSNSSNVWFAEGLQFWNFKKSHCLDCSSLLDLHQYFDPCVRVCNVLPTTNAKSNHMQVKVAGDCCLCIKPNGQCIPAFDLNISSNWGVYNQAVDGATASCSGNNLTN